ncbi:MAG: tetratricopeptide repeat protein [Candidatus Obscuribacterales bacterium]|nr:tetratricopeptide repeat protein [Candidatus Obscuribacterales bacterium]
MQSHIKANFIAVGLTLVANAVIAAESPSALPQSYDELTRTGEIAFGKNNYGQAEKCFLAALREAEKFGPQDKRVAHACKNLAAYYEVRSCFPKAEAYFERELRVKEKQLGAEHPQVIQSVGKLVRFYLSRDNKTKADRLTSLLVAYSDRVVKEQNSVDGHFNELNKFYAHHPEYAEVQKQLVRVREAGSKVRADDHLELAAMLDSIAVIYKERSKFELSEQLFKKSLVLREKTLASDHQALAFSYEHLADLYKAQGRNELAQPLYRQALEVTSKSLQLKRPESYSRLDSLAHSYVESGRIDQAETLYRQALTLLKESTQPRHREIGSASMSLGLLYCKQGRYAEAKDLFKTAMTVTESMHGPQSAALIPVLDSYAEALEKCNSTSEATKIRNRANLIKGAATACKPLDPASDF